MKKLNGYRLSHRNKWLFIKHELLSIQELSLLEFYADIVDFDFRHEEKYGLFEVDFIEISSYFGRKQGIIRQWHNKLLTIGLVNKTNKRHIFRLTCHQRYFLAGKWKGKANHYQEIEKNQPIEIILQSFDINFQTAKEKIQFIENRNKKKVVRSNKTNSIAISSSRDEYKDILP